jgi:hypothetical protein
MLMLRFLHNRQTMQRLTARFLLLFALVGNIVPLALAVTATPPHACCIRKTHRCHGPALAESDQPVVRDPGCCNHGCCRAVTTSQWASLQPCAASAFMQEVDARAPISQTIPASTELAASHSTRAPPLVFIA